MKLLSGLSLAAGAAATGILLPLNMYPSKVYNDGAAAWKPAIAAAADPNNADVPWIVVLNADSGPGGTRLPGNNDVNFLNGTAQFNALAPTVTTFGYVHLTNGAQPAAAVQANITTWAGWENYSAADVGVRGIFFDEAVEPSGLSDGGNAAYIAGLVDFERQAFAPRDITTVCNFGERPADVYYGICDVLIVFESCLSPSSPGCAGAPAYRNETTVEAVVPAATNRSQAAVVVHGFQGAAADGSPADETTLKSYARTLAADGVGWAYFCTDGYADGITAAPANVSNLAAFLAGAQGHQGSIRDAASRAGGC